MNKSLIAIMAVVGMGLSSITAAAGFAGSQSVSGTISGGYAGGSGFSTGNQRPSGAFQRSRAGAWNNTTAGARLHEGGDHANVNAEVRSRGATRSNSRGRAFGPNGTGSTIAGAAQGGEGAALAVGSAADRHHDSNSMGEGVVGAGVIGRQGSLAVTSNVDTGSAVARSRGKFDGEANADLHIDADHNDVHVNQSSDIDVLAGGKAMTRENRGGEALAAGGGEVGALSGSFARTTTGNVHIGPQYNVLDTLDDGTLN